MEAIFKNLFAIKDYLIYRSCLFYTSLREKEMQLLDFRRTTLEWEDVIPKKMLVIRSTSVLSYSATIQPAANARPARSS